MYKIIRSTTVNCPIEEVWEFLSAPSNLNNITPSNLQFEILSNVPDKMFNGLLIEYRIKIPLFGRWQWLTEIKHILDQKSLTLGMGLEEKNAASPEIEITGENQELLNMPCQEMELSVRARRCLQRLGCKNIAELISKTEAELLGCKNFGVTSLNEIKERLTSYGLSLRTLE